MVSVCLTRMNKVSRELTDFETRYSKMQEKMEVENSVYNDTEIERERARAIVRIDPDDIPYGEEAKYYEAQQRLNDIDDSEAKAKKELDSTVLGSRITIDDVSENVNTINRKLSETLHCVVEDSGLLSTTKRLYPYTALQPDESLRSAAERLLRSYSLEKNSLLLSNAPSGVLKVMFREDEERGELYQGAKMFFMKAHLRDDIALDTDVGSTEWLTLQELRDKMSDGYFKRIISFAQ